MIHFPFFILLSFPKETDTHWVPVLRSDSVYGSGFLSVLLLLLRYFTDADRRGRIVHVDGIFLTIHGNGKHDIRSYRMTGRSLSLTEDVFFACLKEAFKPGSRSVGRPLINYIICLGIDDLQCRSG